MRKLLLLLLLFLCPSVAAAEPGMSIDPRDYFTFDDEGNVTTDDGKAERTFWLPAMKTGFIVDFNHRDLTPHLSIELFEFSDFAFNFGVAQSRAFVSFGWEMIPVAKIGPIIWGGYNIKQNIYALGVGVSILDF